MKRYLGICVIVCALGWCRAGTVMAAAQLVFDVPPEGGIYEVPVHSSFLTILYFPSPVTSFVHSQGRLIKVEQNQHILSVEVEPGARVTTMSVECANFRVGVLLRPVGDAGAAAVQVQFRDQSQQQRVEAELNKQTVALQAKFDAQRAAMQAEFDVQRAALARERVAMNQDLARLARHAAAQALHRRHRETRLNAFERRGVELIVRALSVVWLGDDAYLRISMQNRGPGVYRIDGVEIYRRGKASGVDIVFPRSRAGGDKKGVLSARSSQRLILILPNVADMVGELMDIHFSITSGGVASELRMTIPLTF